MTSITYPAWMDLTATARQRLDSYSLAGSPAHGFTVTDPRNPNCCYCFLPESSVAHRVGALAATYGPKPPTAESIKAAVQQRHGDAGPCTPGDRCVPGDGYKCDAHVSQPASLAEVIAGLDHLAGQVAGIRLDADTIVIAGEKYVRRPF